MSNAWEIEINQGQPSAESYWKFRVQLQSRAGDDTLNELQLVSKRDQTPTSEKIAALMTHSFPEPLVDGARVGVIAMAIPIIVMLRCIGVVPRILQQLKQRTFPGDFWTTASAIVDQIIKALDDDIQGCTDAYFPASAAHRKRD